jgi:hypothetical protein
MSEGALWRSSDKKQARHERRRLKKMARANYRVEYDLAYDGGGSAFEEYYKTALGARVAAFIHLHIRSWGGSAELYPHPTPIPVRHQSNGKKKK